MGFEFQGEKSLAGMVLAAAPSLLDPNFHQTLVYIAEHNEEGALGFVMNRPLGKKLGEVGTSGHLPDALRNVFVFQGGPVKPTGLLIVRFERGKSDEQLRCEMFTDPEQLIEPPHRAAWLRAFAGHSGWGEGQLDAELRERAWAVCRPHIAMMEEPVPAALWHAFVSKDQRWRKLHSLLPKTTELN